MHNYALNSSTFTKVVNLSLNTKLSEVFGACGAISPLGIEPRSLNFNCKMCLNVYLKDLDTRKDVYFSFCSALKALYYANKKILGNIHMRKAQR